jgi:hypothetical protein
MSSTGAFPLGAALPDFNERLFTVNKLAAVSLLIPDGDFRAQFGEPELLQLFAFLEKPESLSQHFALGLVQTSFQEVGDELIEHRAKIDVHTDTIAHITIIVSPGWPRSYGSVVKHILG